MSVNGERIGRRLQKRHNFRFRDDPCNFYVRCDREAVELNRSSGRGVCQWVLKVNCGWHSELPEIEFEGKMVQAEIGSDVGAAELLKAKFWSVYVLVMSGENPSSGLIRPKKIRRTGAAMNDFNDALNDAFKYGVEASHEDFHRSLVEQPKEKTNALVYADWLEEQGLPAHAEVIRSSVAKYGVGVHLSWDQRKLHSPAFSAHSGEFQSGPYIRLSATTPDLERRMDWWMTFPLMRFEQRDAVMRRLKKEGAAVSGPFDQDEPEKDQ